MRLQCVHPSLGPTHMTPEDEKLSASTAQHRGLQSGRTGRPFSPMSAACQLLFKACMALIKRNLVPEIVIRICMRTMLRWRVLNVSRKLPICQASSLTRSTTLLHFIQQVHIDLQQHQETGLSIFAQSGHSASIPPECDSYEDSEVCSAAQWWTAYVQGACHITAAAVACRVLSVCAWKADETELLSVSRC